jgi:hypothetical protein
MSYEQTKTRLEYQLERFSRLLANLRRLKNFKQNYDTNPVLTELGICANVDMWSFLTDEEILNMWESWEHYSGNFDFPIPSTRFTERGKWDNKSKQSQQRYLLLDHCIKYLEGFVGSEGTPENSICGKNKHT